MRRALLIGINYIGTDYELRGCINDVINMKNYLKTSYGFQDSEIRVMTELSEDSSRQPTKENMLREIDDLVRDATPESRLFFHYSGHGGSEVDKSKDEQDGYDETIYPLDGEIVDDEIKKHLIDPLPEGAKLTCIFDSCHSGTVLDLAYNYRFKTAASVTSYLVSKDSHYPKSKATVFVFAGCRDDQTSADTFEEDSSQGAMTYGFLKTLKKYSARVKPPSYLSFMKSLCIFLKEKGYEQIPQLTTGTKIDIAKELYTLF